MWNNNNLRYNRVLAVVGAQIRSRFQGVIAIICGEMHFLALNAWGVWLFGNTTGETLGGRILPAGKVQTPQWMFRPHVLHLNNIIIKVFSSGYSSMLTQGYISSPRDCVFVCLAGFSWVCAATLCRDEKVNVHVCVCLSFFSCACVSPRICWTEQVNAGWHMRFTDLLEESRLAAQNLHTQVAMATTKIIFLPSPASWRFQDAEMHKYIVITQQPHT